MPRWSGPLTAAMPRAPNASPSDWTISGCFASTLSSIASGDWRRPWHCRDRTRLMRRTPERGPWRSLDSGSSSPIQFEVCPASVRPDDCSSGSATRRASRKVSAIARTLDCCWETTTVAVGTAWTASRATAPVGMTRVRPGVWRRSVGPPCSRGTCSRRPPGSPRPPSSLRAWTSRSGRAMPRPNSRSPTNCAVNGASLWPLAPGLWTFTVGPVCWRSRQMCLRSWPGSAPSWAGGRRPPSSTAPPPAGTPSTTR
jgi:hypothetical protein